MNLWTNPLVARQLRLNRETLDFWRLYRSHREAVADLISRTPQPGSASLCILGAGNCNDLDLVRFTSRFAQVHLVDLDRQAMDKGVQRQSPPAPGRIRLHGGIDLTGILKTLATWERHRPKRESIAHCIREARAFAGLPVPDRFEVVASMCLLSQIIDSVVSMTGPGAVPLELVRALRQRHLHLLAELLLPGGIGHSGHRLRPGAGRCPPTPAAFAAAGKRPRPPPAATSWERAPRSFAHWRAMTPSFAHSSARPG